MNYIEKYVLVKNMEGQMQQFINDLAKTKKVAILQMKNQLIQDVYNIEKLNKKSRLMLCNIIPVMDEEEKTLLEKVNHMPLKKIINICYKEDAR